MKCWGSIAGGGSVLPSSIVAFGRLVRNSATEIQLEALRPGTHESIFVRNQEITLSTPKTCNNTTNLIDSNGEDSGSTPSASTRYYAYLSSSGILRLSATAPSSGYLGSEGGAANWRYVGDVRLDASTEFEAVGSIRNIPEIVPCVDAGQTIWHNQSEILSGSGFGCFVDTSQMFGFYGRFTSPANGDKWRAANKLALRKGVYSFHLLAQCNTDSGVIDWYLDDTKIGSTDLYESANTYNKVISISNINIEAGLYTLTGVVNGKNASSSDYYSRWTCAYFRQTG